MPLYEVVLQKQCIGLAIYHNVAYVGNLRNQQACFQRLLLFVEVGGDAAFKVLCLAHIDYYPALVEVLVTAG